MRPSNNLILTLAAAAALTACGGGGSSAPELAVVNPSMNTPMAAKGVMIDGYVSGATVFCDSNANGNLDVNEARTTTDTAGAYNLTAGCNGAVVGQGGINVDTGFAFNGVLKAPAGSTVITPLTTLLVGTGLTGAQLAELLGEPAGTDLTKIDVANGQHPELFKKTLAVQQMLDNITRVSTDRSGDDVKVTYSRIASDFAKSLTTQAPGTRFIGAEGDVNAGMLTTIVRGLPDIAALRMVHADIESAAVTLATEAQQFTKAASPDLAALTKALQNPKRLPLNVTQTTSYLALAGDSIAVNGGRLGLSDFHDGIALEKLESIGFNFSVVGAPPRETVSAVALELTERGGANRKLQLMITQVLTTLDASNQLHITVPPGAKIFAYGSTANGTETNLTNSDLSFSPIRVVDNGFTLNYKNIVNGVGASASASGRTLAERFLAIKGTFEVKLVISGLNVRRVDGTAYAEETIGVINTTQKVTGPGFTGLLTLQ